MLGAYPLLVPLVASPVASIGALAARETIRCPVTRDTWVSTAPGEQDGNNGGASKLKTKGYQEFALVDLDPSVLLGRVVTRATLHVRVASKDPQRRVTVSTIATEWVEGDETGYDVQKGSTSFRWAAQAERPWSFPGSDITSAILGQGNTLWRWADATPPDEDGWQAIEVDPDVVAARVAGISAGFLVFDDVGSEYTRDGERLEQRRFLNRFLYSREAGARNAPYFTVELGETDREPPAPIDTIVSTASPASRAPVEATITWTTRADRGPAGVIGFVARWMDGASVFDWERARPVPQYLVPLAGRPGGRMTMRLRDVGHPGAITLGLRAVDRAGNLSPVHAQIVELSTRRDSIGHGLAEPFEADQDSMLPKVSGLEVAVVDTLDKIDVQSGAVNPDHGPGYRRANHLWSAAERRIRLHAARNEFVDFQLALSGVAREMRVSVELDEKTGSARIHRGVAVATQRGYLPDPLVPLQNPFSIPSDASGVGAVEGERHTGLVVEILVARDAARGSHAGRVVIENAGESLALPIDLTVWDFALPDRLSFLPEMNAYSLPDDDVAWYRLAHEHRCVLNRLGYDWRGRISRGCGPTWDGEKFDWKDYDAHFGPLLDGSAFAGLPRGQVPVEAFYLPLNENWPIPIETGFRGGYWADEALAPAYLAAFSRACWQFEAHANEKRWRDTLFEFYLNNKLTFKEREWSRSSAPWIFDEPENTQDFFALRVFGRAFHSGVANRRDGAKVVFRCDLSRPEWRRDLLDGVCDVAVVGQALRSHTRWIVDKQERWGEIVQNYSTTNAIEESNAMPVAWCLDAWTLGADGVIPWQTIGSAESWKKADALALLYPGGPVGSSVPLPSLRLKAFRRGQQDVEYLEMLAQVRGVGRSQVADAVRATLALSAQARAGGSDDAGTLAFPRVGPVELWNLRIAVGQELDRAEKLQSARTDALRPPPRAGVRGSEAFRVRGRDTQ